MPTPEEKLGLAVDERTRFKVRVEISENGGDEVVWLRTLPTLTDAQNAYIDLRESRGLGMSDFGFGEVHDEAGQHVATISYNGRLWPPIADPRNPPVAEAPATVSLTLPDPVRDFINGLNAQDTGVEEIAEYRVRYEGFSEMCLADVRHRMALPEEDPDHLGSPEVAFHQVLEEFNELESGPALHREVTGGDYPVVVAVYHKGPEPTNVPSDP